MSKPCIQQFTYFSLTLNNPDENDMLIIRNPNDKYVKQFIYTPEQGKEGTTHCQCWLRLFRNNSLVFVKKLYPRAHIKGITKDDYNENTQQYAQKNDETTRGKHTITTNESIPEMEKIMVDMFIAIRTANVHGNSKPRSPNLRQCLRLEEDKAVVNRLHLSKMFVAPTWERLYERFHEVYWQMACDIVVRPTILEQGNVDSEDEDCFEDDDSEISC